MSYSPFGLDLSATQKANIFKSLKAGSPITLRISANALKGKGIDMNLTATQINKLEKAKKAGNGAQLSLSASQLKKVGGSLIDLNLKSGSKSAVGGSVLPEAEKKAVLKASNARTVDEQDIANQVRKMKTVTPEQAVILKEKKEGKLPDPTRRYDPIVRTKKSTPLPTPDFLKESADTGVAEAIIAKKVQKKEVKSAPLKKTHLQGDGLKKVGKGLPSSNLAKNIQKVADLKTKKNSIAPLEAITAIKKATKGTDLSKLAVDVLDKKVKINPLLPVPLVGEGMKLGVNKAPVKKGGAMALLGNPQQRHGNGMALLGAGQKKTTR